MTEHPDTARIRADLQWEKDGYTFVTLTALCDALDAARADTAEADRVWRMWKSRAETAEALLHAEQDNWAAANERAEAAEARIAELERRLHPGQGEGYANEVERQRAVIEQLQHVALGQKARIAAALDICKRDPAHHYLYAVRCALTEGTGQ